MGKTKDAIAAAIVEFLGTFFLCLMGGYVCLSKDLGRTVVTYTGVAAVHGLILAIMIWAGAAISGAHYNWAVTLTMAGLKRITIGKAILYLISQTLGSIAAGFTIFWTRGAYWKTATSTYTGYPTLNPDYDQTVGFFCEAIATALLVYMIMALAVDKKGPEGVFGIGIGLALFVAVLSIGPVTGACLNPARLLGPFIVAQTFGDGKESWTNIWIYMLGPIFGALLGGFYYEFFMLGEENDDELEEVDSDEEKGDEEEALKA
jgi:MIP family channel proteins